MVEDGRPSERGHVRSGCLAGLIPLVLRLLFAELYPTPTRKALLRAIQAGHGRIYGERKEVWDKALAWRVTDKVRQLLGAGWIRALEPDESRGPGELDARTYYRTTDEGRKILEGQ